MIVPAQAVRVVIATKPIDFRRGHDSLAAYAQNELKLDPHSGVLIVFRSRRGDRIKVLVWDGSGLVLVYKRLEEGSLAETVLQNLMEADVEGTLRCRSPGFC
jgi:transposase